MIALAPKETPAALASGPSKWQLITTADGIFPAMSKGKDCKGYTLAAAPAAFRGYNGTDRKGGEIYKQAVSAREVHAYQERMGLMIVLDKSNMRMGRAFLDNTQGDLSRDIVGVLYAYKNDIESLLGENVPEAKGAVRS